MRSRIDHRRPLTRRAVPKKGSLWQFKNIDLKQWSKSFIHKHKKTLFWTIGLILVVLALIPPATYLYFASDLKDKESIMNRGMTGLTLQDREGETFYTFFQPKGIKYVSLSEIPESTQKALIATEDKNFYTNKGVSVRGILRAFFVNLKAGEIVEGGSTISQGLAKNAFLSSSRNFIRKYQELVLALELNRRFSKEDILEMYLNSVYFGEGAFGIENAAEAYFGIPAKDLNLAQSTLLIGILPAPSAYSPLSNSDDNALIRQRYVLGEMVEEGYITQAEADAAIKQVLEYNPNFADDSNTMAPHFAVYIKNKLIEDYGEERVIREGFVVKTTLDRNLQTYAEQTVKNRVEALQWNKASNSAAVAIDPKTSQILAMVGSYDWYDERFGQTNMSLIPRQPGSSFKPIIYAKALEEEIVTPATIIEDKKTIFSGGYEPKNYDKSYHGDVTVRRALANSFNIPAVKVMEDVGVSPGISAAEEMGITTLRHDVNYGLSLVLGTGEVPLLEMTNAYAVFANEGMYNEPTGIIEVKNKYGDKIAKPVSFIQRLNPLNWFRDPNVPKAKEVLSKGTAFLISSILSDNNARAETFGGALTINRPAAVKTGTTEDYRDALTIGYTPKLVVGVWVGNNDNTPMDNVAGSLGAAPVWRNIMEHYLIGTPVEQFEKPTFIVEELVCPPGRSPYKEFFIAGTQPDSCVKPTKRPTTTTKPSRTPTPTKEKDKDEDTNNDSEPTETPTPSPTPEEFPTPTPVSVLPTVPIIP